MADGDEPVPGQLEEFLLVRKVQLDGLIVAPLLEQLLHSELFVVRHGEDLDLVVLDVYKTNKRMRRSSGELTLLPACHDVLHKIRADGLASRQESLHFQREELVNLVLVRILGGKIFCGNLVFVLDLLLRLLVALALFDNDYLIIID